jgi:CBS domain-containing protein
MIISRSMNPHVMTASPFDSLKSAAQIMEENDFDALPICKNGRLIGMLTIKDIALKAVAYGLSLEQTRVSQCMAFEAKYVFADQTIAYVVEFMTDQQLRSVLVLDRDYELVGVVSLADLVNKCDIPANTGQPVESTEWRSHRQPQYTYQDLAA